MAAIKISLVADVRSFVAGFKKGTDSVEDLEDEVKDLAKSGDVTAKSIVDNFEDIVQAAKEAQKASARIGDGADSSLGRAKKSTNEFKDEAKQNFGEVASSFSGDMASAADLVQGTLGGLAASIGGPLGLALGAASIALGAFIAMAQGEAEKAAAIREKAIEDVQEALAEGIDPSEFIRGTDQIIEQLETLQETGGKGFEFMWEADTSALDEFQEGLEGVGEAGMDVADVLALDDRRLKQYTDQVREAAEQEERRQAVLYNMPDRTAEQDEELRALGRIIDARSSLLGYLDDEVARRKAVADATKTATDSGLAALQADQANEEARADAAEENAQRRIDAIDSVAASVDTAYAGMVEDATAFATAEDGSLDINRWLTYVQEHAVAVQQYQANLQALTMSPEDWTALLAMPQDARTQWVSQVAGLPEEARQPFIDALDGVIGNAGSSAEVAFNDSFDPEADVDVDVTADTAKATAAITKVETAAYAAKIKVTADTAGASQAIDTAARGRSTTVTVTADTSPLTRRLAEYSPPTVYVPAVLVKPGTRQPI